MIDKLGTHYSMTTPASVYDEEALTALELAGRTTAKVNECVDEFNKLDGETDRKLTEFEKENIPAVVRKEVSKQIKDGTFDEQISESLGNLNDRVDNLLGTVVPGATTMDAEIIDTRTDASGVAHQNAGAAVRHQIHDLRDVISKPNLIDRKKLVKGYIDTNDNEFPQTGSFEYHTDYIPVEGNHDYFYHIKHNTGYVSPWARVCYYDVVKHKLGDKTLNTSNLITTPADARYIRLSFRSGMFCNVKLEEGNYATVNLDARTAENLVDDYPLCLEGYLTTSGHIGDQTPAGHVPGEPVLKEMTSEFVPVTMGQEFVVYNDSEKHPWFSVAFHDGNGAFISRLAFENGRDKVITFTVPEGAAAMRFCARTLYLTKLIVAKAGTNMADYCALLAARFNPSVRGYSPTVKGVAHRGLSSVAPENTLASIRAAAKAGFKYVEFDVRYTSDGVGVLMHDENVGRTTNQMGNISTYDSNDLSQLDAGSWFGPEFAGEPVPTLDQAMALCMELGLHPYVEFKAVYQDIRSCLNKYVNLYGAKSFTVLASDATWCLDATGLGIRAGYVTSDTYVYGPIDTIGQTASSMESECDVSLIFYDWDVNAWNTIAQHEKDDALSRWCVELWTVDDETVMVNADAYHVTGITSNTLDASQVRYNHAMEGN